MTLRGNDFIVHLTASFAKCILVLAALAGVGLGLAACGGGHANKAGATLRPTVTLRLEMPDPGDAQGKFFVSDVARRSGGTVQIRIDPVGYNNSRRPANELALARALVAGRESIGYLPARAWAAYGIAAFKALLAPFVATTDRTAGTIASASVASQVLNALPSQIVGVALVPAEPRRVLSNRAPTTRAAFMGLRIRVVDNPQSAADFSALGALPVQGLTTDRVFELLARRRLDAVESSPSYVVANAYFNVAPYLSAYAIFLKFQSIVLNRHAWNELSASQKAAVRAAAADTVQAARIQVPIRERQELSQLCQAHVRVVTPTPTQLGQLVAAAQPAIRPLLANPTSRSVIDAIRSLRGAGPHVTAGPIPGACNRSQHAGTSRSGKRPAAATIPAGVYATTTTVAALRVGGVLGPDFNRDITYTTTIRNGRWYQTQAPNYPDQGPFSGTYTVRGNEVRWVMLSAGNHGQNAITAPETVRWSYFAGLLRFQIVDVADPNSVVLYTAQPWRKIH